MNHSKIGFLSKTSFLEKFWDHITAKEVVVA